MSQDGDDPGGHFNDDGDFLTPSQENVSTSRDAHSEIVPDELSLEKIYKRLNEISNASILANRNIKQDLDSIFDKIDRIGLNVSYLCQREENRQSHTKREKRRNAPYDETPEVQVTHCDTPLTTILTPTLTNKTYASVTGDMQKLNQINKQGFRSNDKRDRGLNLTDLAHNRDMERAMSRTRKNTLTSQIGEENLNKKVDPVEALMAKAARTVGLRPITESRTLLHATRIRDSDNEIDETKLMEEAKTSVVKDFLENELGMDTEAINQLEIDVIFKSKKGKLKDTLYVRMKDKKSTAIVYGHARNIHRNPESKASLEKYIPHQTFERYQAFENMAFNARKDNYRTDVRIGRKDFIFREKKKRRTLEHGVRSIPRKSRVICL